MSYSKTGLISEQAVTKYTLFHNQGTDLNTHWRNVCILSKIAIFNISSMNTQTNDVFPVGSTRSRGAYTENKEMSDKLLVLEMNVT